MSVGQVSIGLDIGGTKIAAGIMDEQGTILERLTVRTDAAGGGAVVLEQVLEVIGNLVDRTDVLGYGLVGLGLS
ncbi:MAG: ROK family protein [Firmicutes bacterium]|nr:ROK family protein [Bacillota bacterium]